MICQFLQNNQRFTTQFLEMKKGDYIRNSPFLNSLQREMSLSDFSKNLSQTNFQFKRLFYSNFGTLDTKTQKRSRNNSMQLVFDYLVKYIVD